MNTVEQSQDKPTPQPVSVPDELREFFEIILTLIEGIENGTYDLPAGESRLCWGELTWSELGVFRTGMIGFPYENLSEFEFQYSPYFRNSHTLWEFDLSRDDMAQIAAGAVKYLTLYECANPLCGYKTSHQEDRCQRCHLEAGAEINGPHSQPVLGVCPYCYEQLRSLYAWQCPHCRMDWHDADHVKRLDPKS